MIEMNRRQFLKGIAGIIAASAAPAIILKPGVLMPVRQIWTPTWPMREVMAYDIRYDAMMVRYDAMVDGTQLHIDMPISHIEFVEGKIFPASVARQKLAAYAAEQGLDIKQAIALSLPGGVEHARILT